MHEETAVAETAYHLGQFLLDSDSKAGFHQMRLLTVNVSGKVDELIRDGSEAILLPDTYEASQKLGWELRQAGSNGLVYPSVRNEGQSCIVAFRTTKLRDCFHAAHYMYHFDGHTVDSVQKVIALEKKVK